MPIVEIHAAVAAPPAGLLDRVATATTTALGIPAGRTAVVWHAIGQGQARWPSWQVASSAPIVQVQCKASYSKREIGDLISSLRSVIAAGLRCTEDQVYLTVVRVAPHELLVEGEIWDGDEGVQAEPAPAPGGSAAPGPTAELTIPPAPAPPGGLPGPAALEVVPVGFVRGGRHEVADDFWGGVEATIELDTDRFDGDALAGLGAFSHVEVVFLFHRVAGDEVVTGLRRPRGREDWEPVGIFAQRGKSRPNRLGVSRARIVRVDGARLVVEGLDAVDGTPVIDLKPWMEGMGPVGAVHEPDWARELMADYHRPADERR